MGLGLHTEILTGTQFKLLHDLLAAPCLSDFYLAGGTAVALYFGHRESSDFDLFTSKPFDSANLIALLGRSFLLENVLHEDNTCRFFVNDVKIELFAHNYPLIDDLRIKEGIRLAGLKDLVAMKLNAVAGRGSKKDFWDIASLLEIFPLEDMLSYFRSKYQSADEWHLIRSLTYFDDAEREGIEIKSFRNVTWKQVKDRIIDALKNHNL